MARSSIEWLNHLPGFVGRVTQPVTGCTGSCPYCYARRQARRKLPHGGFTDRDFTEVRCHPERLEEPLHWKKPSIIFVCSMADLFGPQVPYGFIDRVFAVMALCPQHRFVVLTKQAAQMRAYFGDAEPRQELIGIEAEAISGLDRHQNLRPTWTLPLPNVALGVSIVDQPSAELRMPDLIRTPAAIRVISYEPAQRPVDLRKWLRGQCPQCHGFDDYCADVALCETCGGLNRFGVDMVIAGAQSGPGAPDIGLAPFLSLRDQCTAAGVPYFLKQARIDGKMVSLPELDGRRWAEYPLAWRTT